MRRLLRALLMLLIVATGALCLRAAAVNGADVKVRVRVNPGVNLVFITETDGSGLYKVVRVGQSAFKLVNFDANVSVQVVNEQAGAASAPDLTVCYTGSNGPDPVPPLAVAWLRGDLVTGGTTLYPGQTSSCSGCDLQMKFTN